MAETIDIDRFEVALAPDGDVMICFISRAVLQDGAAARLEGSDLFVSRGPSPAIRFKDIAEPHQEWIREAPALYVRVSGIEDRRVRVRLSH